MGTDKRERQKANRQLRLEEMARQHQRQQTKRRALQIGIVVLAAVAIAAVFFIFGGGDDGGTADTTPATVSTTASGDSTTSSIVTDTEVPESTVPGATLTGATPCPAEDGSSERVTTFEQPPPVDCIDVNTEYTALVSTNRGDFTITLDPSLAPQTVANFVGLARYHYFDGVQCHRVVQDFVVQCGDPTATGGGGPGYEFADELPASLADYTAGAVAMANSGPDTNGSQFFIVTTDEGGQRLPGPNYSLFGHVTQGMDSAISNMNKLAQPNEVPSAVIQIKTITICPGAADCPAG